MKHTQGHTHTHTNTHTHTQALDAVLADPALKSVVADPKAVNKILSYHAIKGAHVFPSFTGKVESLPTLVPGQSVTVSKARGLGGRLFRGSGCPPAAFFTPAQVLGHSQPFTYTHGAHLSWGPNPPKHQLSKQVVKPKAGGNIGTVTITADSAGAKPVAVKKHNIIAGASYIDSECFLCAGGGDRR